MSAHYVFYYLELLRGLVCADTFELVLEVEEGCSFGEIEDENYSVTAS